MGILLKESKRLKTKGEKIHTEEAQEQDAATCTDIKVIRANKVVTTLVQIEISQQLSGGLP